MTSVLQKSIADYNRRQPRHHLRQSPRNQSSGEVVMTRPTYTQKIPGSDLGRQQRQSCLKFDMRPGSPQTIRHNTQTAPCNRPRPFFVHSFQYTRFCIHQGRIVQTEPLEVTSVLFGVKMKMVRMIWNTYTVKLLIVNLYYNGVQCDRILCIPDNLGEFDTNFPLGINANHCKIFLFKHAS
jgi:hypothetical protein